MRRYIVIPTIVGINSGIFKYKNKIELYCQCVGVC